VLDGVTFCVKFLGSTLIEKTGASDAAEATKTVIQMVKSYSLSEDMTLTMHLSSHKIQIYEIFTRIVAII